MTTEPLKTRVATYLTGTRARQDALTALAATNWFTMSDELAAADALNKFLTDNPTNSCRDGIERFRRAVDFPEPKPEPTLHPVMRITFDAQLDPARIPNNFGGGFGDNNLVIFHGAQKAILGLDGVEAVRSVGYQGHWVEAPVVSSPYGVVGDPTTLYNNLRTSK